MKPDKRTTRSYKRCISVTAATHARLKAIAKERGVSLSSLIEQATADIGKEQP